MGPEAKRQTQNFYRRRTRAHGIFSADERSGTTARSPVGFSPPDRTALFSARTAPATRRLRARDIQNGRPGSRPDR